MEEGRKLVHSRRITEVSFSSVLMGGPGEGGGGEGGGTSVAWKWKFSYVYTFWNESLTRKNPSYMV